MNETAQGENDGERKLTRREKFLQEMIEKKRAEEEGEMTFSPRKIAKYKKDAEIKGKVDHKNSSVSPKKMTNSA